VGVVKGGPQQRGERVTTRETALAFHDEIRQQREALRLCEDRSHFGAVAVS
jgi:hypothetical protein